MVFGLDVPVFSDYVQADGKLVAEVFTQGSNVTVDYFVSDHLGSPAVIIPYANSTQGTIERDSYDAWGKMRNATNWGADTSCSLPPASDITRHFTGHESLAAACLVNANARIYDPQIGRFLTPDSVTQDTYNLQNLNRYSYVDNMPLSLTDPTGHDGNGPGNPPPPPPPLEQHPPQKWFLPPCAGRCIIIGKVTVGVDSSSGQIVSISDDAVQHQSPDASGTSSSGTTTSTSVGGVGNPVAGAANANEYPGSVPGNSEPADQSAPTDTNGGTTGTDQSPSTNAPTSTDQSGTETVVVTGTRVALNDTGGSRPDKCEVAWEGCHATATRLHDLGYVPESHQLFQGCQAASRTCYQQEQVVKSPPPGKKYISVVPFPPNPETNGGGTVVHETGEPSRYLPPSYDPLAGIPPKNQ